MLLSICDKRNLYAFYKMNSPNSYLTIRNHKRIKCRWGMMFAMKFPFHNVTKLLP